MKPLAVIVSGEPGSGKTTVARAISDALRILHVERDAIVGGIQVTLGREIDRQKEGVLPYYTILRDLLRSGVSIVTDGTLYRGVSEQDIRTYIADHAVVVNVHTYAKASKQRFYEREMSRVGWPNDWVGGYMSHLDAINERVVEPLDLGAPIIKVTTDGTLSPTIEAIVTQIRALYQKSRSQKMQT